MDPILIFSLTGLLVMLGATVSALTGFGFGIMITPFFLLLHPPKAAVPLVAIVALLGASMQWLRVRQHTDWRIVALLALGAIPGLPLGGYILLAVNPDALKALIGAAVLIAAVMALVRRDSQGEARRPGLGLTLASGFGSGLLVTSVGQPGLVTALFMAYTRLDKSVVRATLVSFFILNNLGALITYQGQGVLTRDLLITGASLAPFYWGGLLLGDIGFQRSTQQVHRRISLGVLTITSVVAVVNGVSALVQ